MTRHGDTWTRATLGNAAADGDPITVWCNNRACGYWLEHGKQYRAVLTAAFIEFRARLRCRHCGSGDVSTIANTHYDTPKERWEREAR
jgi:hypothetical protein